MKITTDKDKLTEEIIAAIYVDNKVQFSGDFNLVNIINSVMNGYLVITVWDKDKLIALCSLVSDGTFYGRIQELITTPDYEPKDDLIALIIQYIYKKYPTFNSLHLNPRVHEKKTIYSNKYKAKTPQMKKLFWSIHEDEF